jgi:hypothetical protein
MSERDQVAARVLKTVRRRRAEIRRRLREANAEGAQPLVLGEVLRDRLARLTDTGVGQS